MRGWAGAQALLLGAERGWRWPAAHACIAPAGLSVYLGYGVWHSKENWREPPGLVTARHAAFPDGRLEETAQDPGQAPAQGPGSP